MSPDDLELLYVRWLCGESLRTLAASLPADQPMSHNTIKRAFVDAYGPKATNPTATSLARSILADYGHSPEIVSFALKQAQEPEAVQHRSRHSIRQLSIYQAQQNEVVLDIVSSLAQYDDVGLDRALSLPFFSLFATCLTKLLAVPFKQPEQVNTRAEAIAEKLSRACKVLLSSDHSVATP